MSSLYMTAGKKYFRLLTLVIGFSAFFAPLLPLTQTAVMAQSNDTVQTFETEKSNATTADFEREYLPSNISDVSKKQEFFNGIR